MSESNSTPPAAADKPAKMVSRCQNRESKTDTRPAKPSPDFPLFPHATRRWAKKVKGKMVYFGPWADPQGALKRYLGFLEGKPARKPKRRPTGKGAGNPEKPNKPYPEFPLFPHASKRWAKKIRGQLVYFGKWADHDAALTKYLDQKDDLHAGRTPRVSGDGLTVKDLCNRFLTSKKMIMDAGELSPRTWQDYYATCERLITAFGNGRQVSDLVSDDFEKLRATLAKTWGPVSIGNEINRVRVLFKYALDNGLMDHPVRYGQGFKRPSRKVLRLHRAKQGPRMFEADEIRALLTAAGAPMRAMILLAVNGGLGNSDVGQLPLSAVDLQTGWVNYPRPKTGIERRFRLWPETVAAVKKALAVRPEAKDPTHVGLVFVTKTGGSWHKPAAADSPVSKEMTKLLKALGIDGHRNFYALRHTLETVGGEARDQVAVDHIMGHARNDMASLYREKISDERLEAVAAHVRGWLFKVKE